MSTRAIYNEDGYMHCRIGEIIEENDNAYTIEYVDNESITGKTNLKTIKKSNIVDIINR